MATERGWWNLTTTVELSDEDRAHIASMIKDGFTEGEVCVTDDETGEDHTP